MNELFMWSVITVMVIATVAAAALLSMEAFHSPSKNQEDIDEMANNAESNVVYLKGHNDT